MSIARAALEQAVAQRTSMEERAQTAERVLATLLRGRGPPRGLARLAGQVAARRSRVEATEAEIGRLRESLAETERRGTGPTSSSRPSRRRSWASRRARRGSMPSTRRRPTRSNGRAPSCPACSRRCRPPTVSAPPGALASRRSR
ncbi:hypothetical protein NKG05_01415 [Oerskovia sp. M15]